MRKEKETLAVFYCPILKKKSEASVCMSTDAVEALRFLMHYCERIDHFAKSTEYASVLLDTGGPEKDEAKGVIRRVRERGF